jgi:hypothetical protein
MPDAKRPHPKSTLVKRGGKVTGLAWGFLAVAAERVPLYGVRLFLQG